MINKLGFRLLKKAYNFWLRLVYKVNIFLENYYYPQWELVKEEVELAYQKLKKYSSRPSFPKLEDGSINLHLGCGLVNHPSFINIDCLPAPHIHYIRNINNLSPFKDNSVDLIYACHCLEHFPFRKIPQVLTEWFRVLKKDGILRLSVPNFDLILDIYKNNGNKIINIVGPLMGGQVDKFDFHHTVFNQLSLEQILKDTGFKNIKKWQPGSCEMTTFDDWSVRQILINDKYYPISLNLEATK